MRLTLAVLFLVAAPGFIAPARADEMADAAKRFFEAASRLFEQGRFKDAAAEYEHAFREQPLPAFAYNAASAYDKAGARDEALSAYKRYLALPKHDPKDEAGTNARIAVLEKELAALAQAAPKHTSYPYVEAVSKHAFATYLSLGGKDFVLIGAGARPKLYGIALYVEDEAARAAFPKLVAQAGGADLVTLSRGDQAQQFVTVGEFGKHAVIHFDKALSAAKLKDLFRDPLADDLGDKATPELRRDTEAFLALLDRDVKPGDELNLHADPDGAVYMKIGAGFTRSGPTNQRLTHDLWDTWLGRTPVSAELKSKLIERIDTLGR